MGFAKTAMMERESMEELARAVVIAAGLGTRCDWHDGVFMSEFVDGHGLDEAYKIANARITAGAIKLPSMMNRRDFTDLIKKVVQDAPDFCPECDRIFSKD